jgi:hypothetical protein
MKPEPEREPGMKTPGPLLDPGGKDRGLVGSQWPALYSVCLASARRLDWARLSRLSLGPRGAVGCRDPLGIMVGQFVHGPHLLRVDDRDDGHPFGRSVFAAIGYGRLRP